MTLASWVHSILWAAVLSGGSVLIVFRLIVARHGVKGYRVWFSW